MQQYCRPSSPPCTWLWKEFQYLSCMWYLLAVRMHRTLHHQGRNHLLQFLSYLGAPSSLHQFILSNAPEVDRWQKGPILPLLYASLSQCHCATLPSRGGAVSQPLNLGGPVSYFGQQNVAEWGLGLKSPDMLLFALSEPRHHHQHMASLARWEDEGPCGEGSAWPSLHPCSLQTAHGSKPSWADPGLKNQPR